MKVIIHSIDTSGFAVSDAIARNQTERALLAVKRLDQFARQLAEASWVIRSELKLANKKRSINE